MKRTPVIRFILVLMTALVLSFSVPGPVSAAPEQSDFISPETVVVGCGAGFAAGAFAAWLPALWALPGQATLVTLPIVTAWGLIGCGVGVTAGLSAVLSQAFLNAI